MRFEYSRCEADPGVVDKTLAAMGADGWELCVVEPPSGISRTRVLYFKRAVTDDAPSGTSEGKTS